MTCGPLRSTVVRLARDRSGNFAIITALTMLPVLLSIGAAVDMSLFYRGQRTVQAAIDAAALAAAKQFPLDDNRTRLEAYARNFFDANTASLYRMSATMTYDGTEWTEEGTRELHISSCYTYSPLFLAMLNISAKGIQGSTCAKSESVVVVGSTSVEVAMVLDTSGSMLDAPDAGGAAKISTLKTVATKAVNTLFSSGTKAGEDPVRVGVVPFSGAVNVGPTHMNDWWMDPKGLSSIHHENLDWSNFEKEAITGLSGAAHPLLYPNAWVKRLSLGTFLTRQYIYDAIGDQNSAYKYKGCVEARKAPYALTDDVPRESVPDTLFVPYFAPDEGDSLKKGWVNNYLSDSDDASTDNDNNNDNLPANFNARTEDVRKYFVKPLKRENNLGANNLYSPNYLCDSNPLQPLSADKSQTLTTISGLVAVGSTNVDQGVGWGWRVLSNREPFTQGREAGDDENIKAMIVMTDGENTYYQDNQNATSTNKNVTAYGSYGFGGSERIFDYKATSTKTQNNSNYTLAMDARTSIVCENAKNDGRIPLTTAAGAPLIDEKGAVKRDGVIIYTIAFDIPASSKTRVDALLKGCASYKLPDLRDTKKTYAQKGKYFYSASNAAELDAAFTDIMASLSNLRISR